MPIESPQRTAWLPSVRVYGWEREVLNQACRAEGVKLSEFIRRVLVDVSRRRIAREHKEGQ
jgi:hypothetical protein